MIQGPIHILKNDSVVQTLVGENKAEDKCKVYPMICPQPEKAPYLVLEETAYAPEACKEGRATTYNGSFNVLVYAESYDDLIPIVNAVIDALDKKSDVTANGVTFSEILYVTRVDKYADDRKMFVKVVSFDCVVNEDQAT